ncbi:MAG: RNA-directed DNA polymerase, partial [Patescibacteria group bacterium]|nr:RNA-directed DNA polymerase [Patescibacteria group bacterium]
DIASFFMSIDHKILYDLTLDLIKRHKQSNGWKQSMADLARTIIFHNPKENYIRKGDPRLADLIPAHKSLLGTEISKGLPIGNYSSQFFANLYLNKLDHYTKRVLNCRQYMRYVDDLLLLSDCCNRLKYFKDKISKFLDDQLNLKLNKNKTIIQPINRGINFLGYFVKLNRIYPCRSVRRRYKDKLYKAAIGLNELTALKLRSIAASYAGHTNYF